jgi:hypothetical protein
MVQPTSPSWERDRYPDPVPETYRVAWQGEAGPRPGGPTVTLETPPAEGETINLDDGTRAAVEQVGEVAHWRTVVWARRLPRNAS